MRLTLIPLFALLAHSASASDACSTQAISTVADVTVSDGSSFKTESYFHSLDNAAIRHLDHRDRWSIVEGPYGWVRVDDDSRGFSDFQKLFALGHQYHALLLGFDDMAGNLKENAQVEFGGVQRTARSGDYPYGGTMHLVAGDDPSRPIGMRFDFSAETIVEAEYLDWREHDGQSLPFHIRIDDGDRVFDYRYTDVDMTPRSLLWFFDSVAESKISRLQIYRLHRKLLVAHCLGDADLMAELSAPSILSANGGEVTEISNAAMKARFTSLFEAIDYTEYHDLTEPHIEYSDDIGWITVNTRAVGKSQTSDQTFDDQWAWIMTVRKIDGVWLHSGNASNRK